jgi:hypothetical protein
LPISNVLIDDRLLVAHLLGAEPGLVDHGSLHTTTYWYYRACRAAVAGAAGQLSGPFRALPPAEQETAVQAMLRLPERIGLPDARRLAPEMVGVHRRHTMLNLLNVEAAAAARLLSAKVLLSSRAAEGVLPSVLDQERISWEAVTVPST